MGITAESIIEEMVHDLAQYEQELRDLLIRQGEIQGKIEYCRMLLDRISMRAIYTRDLEATSLPSEETKTLSGDSELKQQ